MNLPKNWTREPKDFQKQKKPQVIITEIDEINQRKEKISQKAEEILSEEYNLLNKRVSTLENKKQSYIMTMLATISCSAAIILTLNWIILSILKKKTNAEVQLKSAKDRLLIAIEGTQDGIFDWDIKEEKIFYSARFMEMLGLERKAVTGTVRIFNELLHPDDYDRVWNYAKDYLAGKLSEYSNEFRMKHKSGRWIWIQSRAKAIFDQHGNPVRLVGAHTDISAAKMIQTRLAQDKAQAEKANRAKTDFLAHMSHEIRTPLTAISGIAEIFGKRQENFDNRQKQLVRTLIASASSLTDLVNDVLDFARIESGEVEIKNEEFQPREVFEAVISILNSRAYEKGIGFIFDYADIADISIFGDKARLRQILINLTSNAVKFTHSGHVTITAFLKEKNGQEHLQIDVADSGIGIAAENMDIIFERFRQADDSTARKYGGTGLGLPISRNLAHLMGGDIFVESTLGKGSVFSLSLPTNSKDAHKNNKITTNKNMENDNKAEITTKTESRVLVAEDYEGNVVILSYILEDMGLYYDIARNGAQAVELWQKNHYDLILMDVQMPEMDGFTATNTIRTEEKEKNISHIPIVGMTAHAFVEDKNKCIDSGMNAYLPKPLVEEDFKNTIKMFLNKK